MGLEGISIGVIGLGYVGLPLAVEFGKKYPVIGFDIDEKRINELSEGHDATLEVVSEEIQEASNLKFSSEQSDLAACNFYIVTVPTPINSHKQPEFKPLIGASETIAAVLKPNDFVVYESTVYPGATEEVCVPILEQVSGLKVNHDFYVGYSPERINPGDKKHRLTDIVKVTSGSSEFALEKIDQLYSSIITAGTYPASSIKVAEAAKVIENTQRDVNIGLINELSLIFDRLGIDTSEVLSAAGTKWNFLPFTPGLVGGHCIGVDPYYLTHKAQAVGYQPEIILAGRRVNDGMGSFIAKRLVKDLIKKRIEVFGASVLIMGLSFKENCPDIRNTRVIDIKSELEDFGVDVEFYDPWVSKDDAKNDYDVELISSPKKGRYDAVVFAVSHKQFLDLTEGEVSELCKSEHVIYDVKALFPSSRGYKRL